VTLNVIDDAHSAIVSGGLIGDAAGGTFLTTIPFYGILAAKGSINFLVSGVGFPLVFQNLTPGGSDANAIDAMFQPGTFDLGTNFDLGGLAMMLSELATLHVSGGHLVP
jgi:hypothetical protein